MPHIKFSSMAKHVKSSAIREVLKYSENPEMISFGGGYPSPSAFPRQEIIKLCKKVLEEHSKIPLQYGPTEGLNVIRDALAKRMHSKHIRCTRKDILITTGSQQAIFLLSQILLDKNDIIIVERPSYLGALNAFSLFQPKFVDIEMDHEGMKTDELERLLKHIRGKRKVKFLYTVPTFQNPTGYTMVLERRKHLIELADRYDFMIIEDDPYAELYYSGKDIRKLKSLSSDRVVYLSSFSKILCPAFRLAWMIAPKEILEKASVAKQSVDLCSSNFTQFIAYEYMNLGIVDRQIKKIRSIYKRKRDIMLSALDRHLTGIAQWTRPEGGMFIWVELKKHINTYTLFKHTIREKVVFIHGAPFFVRNPKYNTMRLNFTNTDDNKIEEGIKRLRKAIDRMA